MKISLGMKVKMAPCMMVAYRIEANPTIAPTERSMPPIRMTKVMPSASKPVKLAWVSRLARLM